VAKAVRPFLHDSRFVAAFAGTVLAVTVVDLVLQVVFHDANWWVLACVFVGFGLGMWGRERLLRRHH
jgi:hypothetical protein